jgi:hypothetical protein
VAPPSTSACVCGVAFRFLSPAHLPATDRCLEISPSLGLEEVKPSDCELSSLHLSSLSSSHLYRLVGVSRWRYLRRPRRRIARQSQARWNSLRLPQEDRLHRLAVRGADQARLRCRRGRPLHQVRMRLREQPVSRRPHGFAPSFGVGCTPPSFHSSDQADLLVSPTEPRSRRVSFSAPTRFLPPSWANSAKAATNRR